MIATDVTCRNGHANPEEARFCGTCGAPLGEADAPPPPPPPPRRPAQGRAAAARLRAAALSPRAKLAILGVAVATAATVLVLNLGGGTSGAHATLVACDDEAYAACEMPAGWQEAQTQGVVAMRSPDGLEGLVVSSDLSTQPAAAAQEYVAADDSGRSVEDFEPSPSSATGGSFTAQVDGTPVAGSYVYSSGVVSVLFAPASSFGAWASVLNQVLGSIQLG